VYQFLRILNLLKMARLKQSGPFAPQASTAQPIIVIARHHPHADE
jgi:hypothetical protein